MTTIKIGTADWSLTANSKRSSTPQPAYAKELEAEGGFRARASRLREFVIVRATTGPGSQGKGKSNE